VCRIWGERDRTADQLSGTAIGSVWAVTSITSWEASFWHDVPFGMKYLSKFVASLVVLLVGVLPLFASASCSHAAASGGCCAPDCPMMLVAKVGSLRGMSGAWPDEMDCCKVTLPSPISSFVREEQVTTRNVETRGMIVIDPKASLTFAGHSHLVLRPEHTPQHPRSSLCIFLI
jgi:hypothetical protein